jgi:hypothetical protein
MLNILLRGYWCGNIILNIPASTGDKSNDSKQSLYGKLEFVFCEILHLLQDLSVNVGRLNSLQQNWNKWKLCKETGHIYVSY